MVQIIKSGTIKVPTQPKDFDLKATGLVFKSYDNQVALEFNVEKQDGTPADLLGANLRLLMFIYDEIDGTVTKEPIPFITKNLITESFLNGHVVYILPEAMKAYNGMVETYVYIEYSDGSTSDNLGFTFRMQRSKIDGLAQDKADYFITDFQQLLDAVKQKAADAVNETLAKVEAVSENVSSAQNDLTILEDRIDQTNQEIAAVLSDVNKYNIDKVNDRIDQTNQKIDEVISSSDEFRTDIDTLKINKADKAFVTAQLEQKAELSYIDLRVAGVVSGAPIVASLAVNMTDRSKNYIYVGSEPGYIAGHWYWWSGSAWTDGGVYLNSQDIDVRKDMYTKSENLLDTTKLLVGYDIYTWNLENLTTSDYTYNQADFVVTPVMPGVPGEQFVIFDSKGKALGVTNIIFFDKAGKYVSKNTGVNTGNNIIIPAGATFWSCTVSKTTMPAMIVKTGSRTDRSYVPYGYVFKGVTATDLKEISNDTQAKIDKVSSYLKSRSSNILDLDNILKDTDLATWKKTDAESTYASTGKYTTPLTNVTAGDIFRTVNKNGTYSTNIGTIMYFDANKNTVSYENTKSVFTVPAGVTGLRFAFANAENMPDAIVKVPSVDTIPSYQPYYIDNFQRAIINEKPLDNIDKSGGYTSIFHKIGVVGDSLASGAIQINAQGIALDRPEYSWGACIARATGCEVKLFSKGGMQAARWNTDKLGQDAVLPENLCTAYIIALGNNDQSLTIGTTADINLTDYTKNANSFYGNYAKIIQRLKEVQPKARFFLTIYPYKTWVDSGVNQAIKDICAMFSNCYLIDLYQYSPFVYGAPNPYMTGSIHLNTVGYQRWAWQIMSYIDYIVRNNISDFTDVELIGTTYDEDKTYV
jgi:lysophospholipase L1-like esterase